MTSEEIERHQRLKEFFKSHPIAQDLQDQFKEMFQNSLSRLIAPQHETRDFTAGQASAFREVMELDNYFRNWLAPKNNEPENN